MDVKQECSLSFFKSLRIDCSFQLFLEVLRKNENDLRSRPFAFRIFFRSEFYLFRPNHPHDMPTILNPKLSLRFFQEQSSTTLLVLHEDIAPKNYSLPTHPTAAEQVLDLEPSSTIAPSNVFSPNSKTPNLELLPKASKPCLPPASRR